MSGERLSELGERRAEWISSVRRGDAEAYAHLVTPGVVWVGPSGEAVVGRPAFRAWVEPFFDKFAYELALHPQDVLVRGDWAIERGQFRSAFVARAAGSASTHEGTYLAIWQRGGDGRWRIDRYFDATNGSPGTTWSSPPNDPGRP